MKARLVKEGYTDWRDQDYPEPRGTAELIGWDTDPHGDIIYDFESDGETGSVLVWLDDIADYYNEEDPFHVSDADIEKYGRSQVNTDDIEWSGYEPDPDFDRYDR